LRTWEEIKDEYKDLWLVIAGDRGSVFDQITFRSSERVSYLGYVNDADLPGLYAGATLFVLPSLEEGFGLPALEAMACGTPVLVSDGGALPEVVGEAGRIFKLSEPDGLSKALRECLDNHDLSTSLVAKGFEQIKKFRWQTTAELVWNKLNDI
jgi:glycosyltransferase involved in cell wall biosynthesis